MSHHQQARDNYNREKRCIVDMIVPIYIEGRHYMCSYTGPRKQLFMGAYDVQFLIPECMHIQKGG